VAGEAEVDKIVVEAVEKIEGVMQTRTRERIRATPVVLMDFQKYDAGGGVFASYVAYNSRSQYMYNSKYFVFFIFKRSCMYLDVLRVD
jgi:hypothetical protein